MISPITQIRSGKLSYLHEPSFSFRDLPEKEHFSWWVVGPWLVISPTLRTCWIGFLVKEWRGPFGPMAQTGTYKGKGWKGGKAVGGGRLGRRLRRSSGGRSRIDGRLLDFLVLPQWRKAHIPFEGLCSDVSS